MSDSLTILGVVDDFGPEQGLVTANQMTDDTTPTVRVSLTTGSGARIGAGDAVKIGDMGSDVAQAVVTAHDVARGCIDVAAHYVKANVEALSAGAYDTGGTQLGSGGLTINLAPGAVTRTDMTDGGHTVSFAYSSATPFYMGYIQRYDAAGHTVGQEFSGNYESGSTNPCTITPLANGN